MKGWARPALLVAPLWGCGFDSSGIGTDGEDADGSGADSATVSDADDGGDDGSGSTGAESTDGGGDGSEGVSDGTDDGDGGSTSDSGEETGAETGAETSGGMTVVELDPDADTFIRQSLPSSANGLAQSINIGSGAGVGTADRALLRFEVTSLDPACNIEMAELRLYFHSDGDPGWMGENVVFGVHRVMRGWNEVVANWISADAAEPWTIPGGDFELAAVTTTQVLGGTYGWTVWDVTDLVTSWCDGTMANNGITIVQFSDVTAIQGRKSFHSSDYPLDASRRPMLRVTQAL